MVALTLVERIVHWVEPAFLTAGYLIIAVAVLLERSVFIGLIVPGDVILALGGVYSAQGKMSLGAVIAIGIAAAITGESIGFWLGKRFGVRLIRRIPLLGRLFTDRLRNAQEFFRKHGGKTVAIGRYATAAGAFVPFTAGLGNMPYRRFIAFDAPAIGVWATGISIFGFVFGRNLAFVDRALSRFGLVVLGLLLGFVAGRLAFIRWRARHPKRGTAGG